MKKPVIGITAVTAFNDKLHAQRVTYPEAVWAAGGEAVLLPCNSDKSNCAQIVSMLDGLLVPGGADVAPELYGEEKMDVCGSTFRFEDEYDMELIKEAVKQGKPILAICRGMQIMNVLYGGTLYQDIPTQYETQQNHSMLEGGVENYHTVALNPDSLLAKILGQHKDVKVNTSHHQAVKDLAEGFTITGRAPDGIPEAMENADGSIICMQWHPERMQDMEMYRNLFRYFIDKCRE
ncbi:MAG: gamma-glutamyl-gamma-aminobutyrate hydrolase family protein [Oscillospiraceae bacterium]|nr:gamma-glutamyl-gamma-aminobutyrate hydrolase family protein [Oscillospiraceae bacterium]